VHEQLAKISSEAPAANRRARVSPLLSSRNLRFRFRSLQQDPNRIEIDNSPLIARGLDRAMDDDL
jgi:hypothetical protein